MARVEGTATEVTVTPLAPVVVPPGTVDAPAGADPDAVGALTLELYEQVLPLHGPDPDGLAFDVVATWIHGTQTIYAIVGDSVEGPGWSRLFDPDRLSGGELRWLGQARGVRLRERRAGESADAWDVYAREAVRAQAAQHRGTVEAQIAAVQATLTGTRWVSYLERVGGDAYQIAVRTKSGETPSPAATLAALLDYEYGQKPAGLLLDYATVTGQTYTAIAGLYASYSAMGAAVASYRSLAEARP